jgi:hypothetical protein
MSKSQMMTVLITFFNIRGIVHFEFIPQGQMINQAHYVENVKWLCKAVCRKRPELWLNDWILYHDNAPVHRALSVEQFMSQKISYWKGTPTLIPSFSSQ